MCHFWAQNGPFAPFFFGKIINITFIYLLAPFIVQSFKKILPADPQLEDMQFLRPKWPISLNKIFFFFFFFSENLLISPVSFIHAIYMPKIKVRY